jgi:hypothetical protein
MLVHWVYNPVDARILANDSVLRVHQDNFKVLVSGILHRNHLEKSSVTTAAMERENIKL